MNHADDSLFSTVGTAIKSRIQPIHCLKSDSAFGGEILSRVDGVVDIEHYFSCMPDKELTELVMRQVIMVNGAVSARKCWQGRCFINIRIQLLSDINFILWICNSSLVPLYLEIDYQDLILSDTREVSEQCIILLRQYGHQIWLDDFTCDFSRRSVSQLSIIDWDGIKIDKSILWKFFHDEFSLQHIVSCCRMLANSVLMEGVETPHHLEVCERVGLDYCQGFHWRDLQLS